MVLPRNFWIFSFCKETRKNFFENSLESLRFIPRNSKNFPGFSWAVSKRQAWPEVRVHCPGDMHVRLSAELEVNSSVWRTKVPVRCEVCLCSRINLLVAITNNPEKSLQSTRSCIESRNIFKCYISANWTELWRISYRTRRNRLRHLL